MEIKTSSEFYQQFMGLNEKKDKKDQLFGFRLGTYRRFPPSLRIFIIYLFTFFLSNKKKINK